MQASPPPQAWPSPSPPPVRVQARPQPSVVARMPQTHRECHIILRNIAVRNVAVLRPRQGTYVADLPTSPALNLTSHPRVRDIRPRHRRSHPYCLGIVPSLHRSVLCPQDVSIFVSSISIVMEFSDRWRTLPVGLRGALRQTCLSSGAKKTPRSSSSGVVSLVGQTKMMMEWRL